MRTYLIKFFLLVLIAITITACKDNDEAGNNNDTNNFLQVKNSEIEEEEKDMSNTEMAEHLAHIASNIPGVNHATAVVLGPYSVVGIDVDKELDRTRVGTIKYSVAEALKQDTHGNNTMVVADGDVMERIRRLSEKVRQGHPEDAIVDELAALIGRYMPEVPQKENQPEEPDTNQKMLDEQKEQQLQNTKNDQSNNQMNR
jgi:YhcN/YlaJ family sporulation lipoprotein